MSDAFSARLLISEIFHNLSRRIPCPLKHRQLFLCRNGGGRHLNSDWQLVKVRVAGCVPSSTPATTVCPRYNKYRVWQWFPHLARRHKKKFSSKQNLHVYQRVHAVLKVQP